MKRYKYFTDPNKQEQWLNEMNEDGYKLIKNPMDFIFVFEKSDKNYVTRLDYRNSMSSEKYEEYVAIHEELGWEHVRGGRFGMTPHTWTKVKDGNDELFSDDESKVNFYKRAVSYTGSLAFIFLIYTFIFLNSYDGEIFLTPGLFDMEGMEFWRAFLFELPFALMRAVPPFIFLIMGIFFFMSYSNLNKAKKEAEKNL